MASKTRIRALVRHHDASAVRDQLRAAPQLVPVRDESGRSWLHLCCSVDVVRRGTPPAAAIDTARVLLDAGLGIDDPAFTEGRWKATPLWFAIAFGQNLSLARYLLERGADPDYCVWAAVNRDSAEALQLLTDFGAPDPTDEDGAPLLAAVAWNRPGAAEALLRLGADVNYRDRSGTSPLLLALRRRRPASWIELLVGHGARLDLPDESGTTARELLRRKRDPRLRALAEDGVG